MIIIGIDPGVNTGYAEWHPDAKIFNIVESMKIHKAMHLIQGSIRAYKTENFRVIFEDARMRGNSGVKAAAQAQGAGSVKRDCKIWEDFLTDMGVSWQAVSPKAKGRKLDAEQFRRLTGWEFRTNEHGRDAGMLVYGWVK